MAHLPAGWETRPHTHHPTIADAGACPECRAWYIGTVLRDARYAFLLVFSSGDGSPQTLSLVRHWSPDWREAVEAAWVTGCNPGGCALTEEIPLGVAIESGVEMFRLHEGSDAEDAYRTIAMMMRRGG